MLSSRVLTQDETPTATRASESAARIGELDKSNNQLDDEGEGSGRKQQRQQQHGRAPTFILAKWPMTTRGQWRQPRSPLGSAPAPDGQVAQQVPRQHDTPNRDAASLRPPAPSRGKAIAVASFFFGV